MAAPLVSINMCCYNGEEFLDEAVWSVCAQTYPRWELVVVNDGSSDGTEQIIKRYIAEGWPIVYHYQTNKGLGAARNIALALSSGEFVAFIDQDDIWLPFKLEKQVPVLLSQPDVGLVYSDSLAFYQGTKKTYRMFTVRRPLRGDIFRQCLRAFSLDIQTVILRREALLQETDWFDTSLRLAEDMDLFLRVLYRWKADYVPQVLGKWRIHSRMSSLRLLDQWPGEMDYVLRKLSGVILDFEDRFEDEIRAVRASVARLKAVAALSAGRRASARGCLREYRQYGSWPVFALLYLLTFLPQGAYARVQYLYRRFGVAGLLNIP